MVSYLNSKPFEFGLKNGGYSKDFELITDTPFNCARLFVEHKVEIALIPSGALYDLTDGYDIITDFCIGCDGEVRTVCIFSNQPIERCKKLITDNHSGTSVLLSAFILDEVFNLKPDIISDDVTNFNPSTDDAVLMIGDKVFEKELSFKYKYDLGHIWKQLTGLPFTFAVWVARKSVTAETVHHLNQSFKIGMSGMNKIIEQESSENLDLYYYFKNNISYSYDDQKKVSIDLFLKKTKKYHNQLITNC